MTLDGPGCTTRTPYVLSDSTLYYLVPRGTYSRYFRVTGIILRILVHLVV